MPIAVVAALVLCQNPASTSSYPLVDPMFSDNMVLQRDRSDPIWGWTTPGAEVTVSIDGKQSSARADKTGKWMARLPRYPAGGSYTVNVSGPASVTFSNVTFGDVWICSGQSNMEFGVGNLANAAQEISAANYPNIRLCRIRKAIAPLPVDVAASEWEVCTPDNLAKDGDWNGFSAVAYFFGRKLNQDLGVPIGLIHTSWGGTIAEAWASEDSLERRLPEFNAGIQAVKQSASQRSNFDQVLADWYAKNDLGSSSAQPWSASTLDDSGWQTIHVPNFVQQVGIPELVNNKSVFWLRRTVDLSADQAAQAATLNFLADDNDSTWVNGTLVGATNGYNVPRSYRIAPGVLHVGSNVIAVRVTDTSAPGGIYGDPAGLYLEIPGSAPISLAGDWRVRLGAKIGGSVVLPTSVGDNPNLPTVLYNGMIYPLAPYGVKGAIWYQGESNAGRGKQYQTLLPTMIESWRDKFGQGNFPFLIVQLAGYSHPPAQPREDGWAELREAQMMASNSSPNAGIATAFDIGEENDIHPKNKQEVGRRLALVAEAKVYGRHLEYSGPRYKSMTVGDHEIRISFDHAAGLKTSDGTAPKGFQVAGEDHVWHWADAKINGSTVVVSSPEVARPVAVRYGWAIFLDVNLQNGEGLPAFPFRTDSWTAK